MKDYIPNLPAIGMVEEYVEYECEDCGPLDTVELEREGCCPGCRRTITVFGMIFQEEEE